MTFADWITLIGALGGGATVVEIVRRARASEQQRAGRVKDAGRASSIFPPAPAPHASRADLEALEEQVVALSVQLGRTEQRVSACEADVGQIQGGQEDLRKELHRVETTAIVRAGETKEKLAELVGAMSQRGGRR